MIELVDFLNSIIWSPVLIYLCLGAGLYFSFKTRFMQIRYFKHMLKLLFHGQESEEGVSSFQAFTMAVSGRVGTGNIAGVATAIALGGPGALFWMWAIAFLGASSAFVEASLAQIYKEEIDGLYRGGPSYYIEKGLGMKWYAVLFSVFSVIAMGLLLPGVQANSVSHAVSKAFGISPYITGGIIVACLAVIIFGGVHRIGKTAEILAPFMAGAYIIIAIVIIVMNIHKLPGVIGLIFGSAFGIDAAFGGILGMAISWGVKRGIYSNEAGQGTGPIVAGAAEVSHPAKQGLVQAFSVYVDTLFVCSATGFMILLTGNYNVSDPNGGYIVEYIPGVEYGPEYTQMGVDSLIPGFGSKFVALALLLFVFTSLMAYYYYAETCIVYLFKEGKNRKLVVNVTRVLLLCSIFYGTGRTADLAWGMGDIGVGLMAWLNIIAIILLRKPALQSLKDYENQLAMGQDPEYNSTKLGVANAEFWKDGYKAHSDYKKHKHNL